MFQPKGPAWEWVRRIAGPVFSSNSLAIAVASSLAFCTPFGTGPNLLVWKPGGYEIKDYFKTGLPLLVMAWLVSSTIIWYFYEFAK